MWNVETCSATRDYIVISLVLAEKLPLSRTVSYIVDKYGLWLICLCGKKGAVQFLGLCWGHSRGDGSQE